MLKDVYINNSNIPKRYLQDISLRPVKEDVETFKELQDIKNNIVDFVNQGKNLFIYSSSVGNGKTTWSTKLLKEYIEQVSSIMFKNNCPALFINVSNFLNKKKLAITNRELVPEVQDLEQKILSAKLVVFDDLGVKDVSSYELNSLYYWIDERTSNLRSCIYTSNLSPQALSMILDSRICSRVVNYSEVKEIKAGDFRC